MTLAQERDHLIKQICASVRSYTPAQRVDEYYLMRVRLAKVKIELLREIVEVDARNCSEGARMALGIGARA